MCIVIEMVIRIVFGIVIWMLIGMLSWIVELDGDWEG